MSSLIRSAASLKKGPWWPRLEPITRSVAEWLWIVRYPIVAWLIARVSLTVLAAWGATSLIMSLELPAGFFRTPRLSGWEELLVDVWQRWDSQWYIKIVTEGYRPERILQEDGMLLVNPTTAFFPLYPGLVWLAGQILPVSYSIAGIVVSTIACLIGLIIVHRLVIHELGEQVANTTVRYLLIFPTAFFFFAVYTESLFLCVTAGACLAAIRRRWWLAGVCGCLATLTRPSGIVIFAPLALEYLLWLRAERRWPRFEIAALALVPAGLVAYIVFLWNRFGDPLMFLHAQQNIIWNREYQTPFQTIGQILGSVNFTTEGLLSPQRINEPVRIELYLGGFYDSNGYNLVFFLFAFVVALLAFRRIRLSLAAFALLMLLFPIFAPVPRTPLISLPRYMLPVFPLFMVLAIWGQNARVDRFLSYPALAFLGIFTVRFATWYWVA